MIWLRSKRCITDNSRLLKIVQQELINEFPYYPDTDTLNFYFFCKNWTHCRISGFQPYSCSFLIESFERCHACWKKSYYYFSVSCIFLFTDDYIVSVVNVGIDHRSASYLQNVNSFSSSCKRWGNVHRGIWVCERFKRSSCCNKT